MLKIQRSLSGDAVTIELIGRILDHDLPQLEALVEAERQRIVLNLKQVTIVGREVVRFLAQRELAGVALQDAQVYLRDWITKEQHQK